MNCLPLPNNPFDAVHPTTAISSAVNLRPDAIFIPTCRKSSAILDRIGELAASADSVWILPSGPAVHSLLDFRFLPSNTHCLFDLPLEALQRSFLELPSSQNPSRTVQQTYDLPLKRNIALAIARLHGFERICLLDDDIAITPEQISAASTVLGETYPLAGFHVLDFPDVSTLDHVHRLITGWPSRTMPGGNCLFLKIPDTSGFFPYIYNEDWLFVIHNLHGRRGVVLGEVMQQVHRPWVDLTRIRFEEFGELIISGLIAVSYDLYATDLESTDFWNSVRHDRWTWLDALRSCKSTPDLLQAVTAAMSALSSFGPEACRDFIVSMKSDLREELRCLSNLVNLK